MHLISVVAVDMCAEQLEAWILHIDVKLKISDLETPFVPGAFWISREQAVILCTSLRADSGRSVHQSYFCVCYIEFCCRTLAPFESTFPTDVATVTRSAFFST